MSREDYVLITTLCSVYEVEHSYFEELDEIGLITIVRYEQESYVPVECIGDFEKILRIRKELKLNPEGIDVVFNLLNRIQLLQEELRAARQQLGVFRSDECMER